MHCRLLVLITTLACLDVVKCSGLPFRSEHKEVTPSVSTIPTTSTPSNRRPYRLSERGRQLRKEKMQVQASARQANLTPKRVYRQSDRGREFKRENALKMNVERRKQIQDAEAHSQPSGHQARLDASAAAAAASASENDFTLATLMAAVQARRQAQKQQQQRQRSPPNEIDLFAKERENQNSVQTPQPPTTDDHRQLQRRAFPPSQSRPSMPPPMKPGQQQNIASIATATSSSTRKRRRYTVTQEVIEAQIRKGEERKGSRFVVGVGLVKKHDLEAVRGRPPTPERTTAKRKYNMTPKAQAAREKTGAERRGSKNVFGVGIIPPASKTKVVVKARQPSQGVTSKKTEEHVPVKSLAQVPRWHESRRGSANSDVGRTPIEKPKLIDFFALEKEKGDNAKRSIDGEEIRLVRRVWPPNTTEKKQKSSSADRAEPKKRTYTVSARVLEAGRRRSEERRGKRLVRGVGFVDKEIVDEMDRKSGKPVKPPRQKKRTYTRFDEPSADRVHIVVAPTSSNKSKEGSHQAVGGHVGGINNSHHSVLAHTPPATVASHPPVPVPVASGTRSPSPSNHVSSPHQLSTDDYELSDVHFLW